MPQNVIIKGKDNPVVITFAFTGDFASLGLNTFTSVSVQVGDETYTTGGPNLSIESNSELRLKIGDVTTLDAGYYLPTIIGYSATYDDGFC